MNEATVSRSAAPSSFQEAVRPGIAAVRRLWLPFVIIQACGLLVVVAYFRSESVRGICGHLARWKHAGGFAFSAAAMAISGAIVPEIALYLTGQNRRFDRRRGRDVVFHLVLFAVSGMSVDAFYRLLAVMIGDSATPGTIAAKVADQPTDLHAAAGCDDHRVGVFPSPTTVSGDALVAQARTTVVRQGSAAADPAVLGVLDADVRADVHAPGRTHVCFRRYCVGGERDAARGRRTGCLTIFDFVSRFDHIFATRRTDKRNMSHPARARALGEASYFLETLPFLPTFATTNASGSLRYS